jgi:hypothetical protein
MYIGLVISILATVISITGLTYIVIKNQDKTTDRTLSKIGIISKKTEKEFAVILLVCGLLFAVAMQFYILPYIDAGIFLLIVWYVTIVTELSLAFLPASYGWKLKVHNFVSFSMATSMWMLTGAIAVFTNGIFAIITSVILLAMFVLALLAGVKRHNFVYYELPYIFLSHISVILLALWSIYN